MLVHQGDASEGDALLEKRWPGALSISDPDRTLYTAFGLGRGSLGQLMGPGTWGAGIRALFKGHFVGKPVGDPLVLPGMFLVEGNEILWSHDFAHSGDNPSAEIIGRAIQDARVRAAS